MTGRDGYTEVAAFDHPQRLQVYEHGWQSWSPSGLYPATATSPRPTTPWGPYSYRHDSPAPSSGFQGEGLLAVVEPDGTTTLVTAPNPDRSVPGVRAGVVADRLVVTADGPVAVTRDGRGLAAAVAAWAGTVALQAGIGAPDGLRLRDHPAAWGSWYCYWNAVTQSDLTRSLADLDRLDLTAPMVQLDDGYQAAVGDWLVTNDRFGPLAEVAALIRDAGHDAGLWTAPFLVGADATVARDHPDWLVGDLDVDLPNWGVGLRVLDVTHPGAADHLVTTFAALRGHGFTLHKCDFLFAGALPGRRYGDADPIAAYREGLRLIRSGIGADATLLGCGAPLLPSVGLVDAMRVGPDVNPAYGPLGGDWSAPGIAPAMATTAARVWQHGRWWVIDPDCIVVRPGEVPERDEWAAFLRATPGLRVSSDHLHRLDAHGLDLTRSLLQPTTSTPADWQPMAFPGPARDTG